MLPEIKEIKGIHPGIILDRELKKRKLKKKILAQEIDEHPQTISTIIKMKRKINPKLSVKLGHFFDIDSDYFMLLQASFDTLKAEREINKRHTPNLKLIRKVLFWDTKFENIEWIKMKTSVIRRVLERGNQQEVEEIIRFYGKETVLKTIDSVKGFSLFDIEKKVRNFLY